MDTYKLIIISKGNHQGGGMKEEPQYCYCSGPKAAPCELSCKKPFLSKMGKIKRKSASPLCIWSLEFWTLLQLCSFISLASLSASAFFSSSWVKGLQDHLGDQIDVAIAKSRKVSTIINVNHGKPHLGDVSDVDIVQHDCSSLSTAQPALECNYEFISKANIQAQESY